MQTSPATIRNRETFKTIPSVYLLLFRENRILLSKRANTGYEDGSYGLVSGHVEAKESLREAMIREAAEEIGLTLSIQDVDIALIMHRFAMTSMPPERLDFFMHIKNWQGEPLNMEPAKCAELCWFDVQNLPENVISYIRHALNEIAVGAHYCEYGWMDR